MAAAPPPLSGLDRAFEIFRVSWRRAAYAQLALSLVTFLSTAWLTAILSTAAASTVIHFTREDGFWTQRMISSVSAAVWQTKGQVAPSGAIASLRTLSIFIALAIAADLGAAVTLNTFGVVNSTGDFYGDSDAYEPNAIDMGYLGRVSVSINGGYSYLVVDSCNPNNPTANCTQGALFALFGYLSTMAYPLLFAHVFISVILFRSWLFDACHWLEVLPRPKPLPVVAWEPHAPSKSTSRLAVNGDPSPSPFLAVDEYHELAAAE
jgi:hypothetical protein